MNGPRVAIVGAGIIGLAIGWRLRQRDLDVTILDSGEPGAWHVAAGMLAPAGESAFEQPALVLFSDSDPIFSRRAAEVMAELLPNAELDPPVEGAGHFLQEDRGEVVGRRIAEWLAR